MKVFEVTIYIIIGISIILMIYAVIYNNIKTLILKINSIENEIDQTLRNKYDLLNKIVSIIKEDIKNEKLVENIESLKDKKLSSFEFERELAKIEAEIFLLKNENKNILKNNDFNDNWYLINNLNTKLQGEEHYYNDNTSIYNIRVSRFPTKLVAKIMKLKEKKYFDGKDMYDKNIKDFKI
ncbi:MAG TPA: LemA family protein [Bacilli bacterium]|nr:LemA family protein [Bacilli bacterium]